MNENPVPPMPFFGREFFEAVSMFSDDCSLKYIRALWFYWSHTHCQGLPDDDLGLRELCKCDVQSWARTKGLIFDNKHFFILENGNWHQRKCRAVYEKTMETIMKNQAKTMPGRIALGTVTIPVTKALTGAELIFKQNALARIEKRIEVIRGKMPLPETSKMRDELDELKIERRAIMRQLDLKA